MEEEPSVIILLFRKLNAQWAWREVEYALVLFTTPRITAD